MDKQQIFGLLKVLWAFFGVAGLMTVGFASLMQWSDNNTRKWKTTTGRVLKSEIAKRSHRSMGASGSGPLFLHWNPEVTYEYTVDGQRFESMRLSNSQAFENAERNASPSAKLAARVAAYPAGREVVVHYQPSNPKNAFLELDYTSTKIVWAAAAVLLLISVILYKFT